MKFLIKCQFTWCVGVQSVQKNAFEENTSGNSLKSLFVSNRQHYLTEMSSRGVEGIVDSALRGGGGHSQYILVVVCRGTSKKGVLGTGTAQTRGV